MAEPWWTPGTCGACIAFTWDGQPPAENEPRRAQCRLRPELKIIPETLPGCAKYVERRTGNTLKIKRAVHGRGKPRYDDDTVDAIATGTSHPSSRGSRTPHPTTSRSREIVVKKPRAYGATIDLGESNPTHPEENLMQTEALKELIRDVLLEEGTIGETTLGTRWEGGTLILKPGAEGQQSKEIPLETFFQKIVSVRDKLRVMEQKINAHKSMSPQEKVEMQQYLTRIYGSLTTFNVLFTDKSEHFVGSKA